MATSSNRDVKLTLSVETLGSQEISRLEASLRELAKQGGDAAPEFERLANEVGRLGEQSDTISSMQRLSDEIREVTEQQRLAAESSQRLAAEYDAARTATNQAAEAQRAVSVSLRNNAKEILDVDGQLRILNKSYDAAGKKTDEYKTKLATLTNQKTQLKQTTVDLNEQQRQAKSAVDQAEAAETKLGKAYAASLRSVDALGKRLTGLNGEYDQLKSSADDLGAATENLAASQAQLLQQLNAIGSAAQNMRNGIQQATAAEEELDAQARLAAQRLQDRIAAARQAYEIDEQIADRRIADANRVAAAEAEAARRALEAKRQEQAESDRLYEIQRQTRERLEIQARQSLAAEMAAQREAADLVKRLERDKQQAIEASAQKQAAAISSAFSTVGLRGANELREEIGRVRAAMDLLGNQAGLTGNELRTAMAAGNAQLRELQRELRAATGELTLADRAANLFKNSMGQIAAGNLIADGIGFLVNEVKDMGRQFIQANLEMERLQRTMTVITGSAQGAADKIAFLREVANTAGQAVGGITDSFIRFNASATASGIAAEQVDEIFKAVTVNGSKMGISTDRVSLALDALGQIASKGTVSMEELRQQLGDSLPGAFAITAKGLGVTTSELVKLVETGQLAATDFFPAFRKGLEDTFGSAEQQVEGLFQAWNRLRNAFRELYQEATGSTAFQLLASGLDTLAANLRTVAEVTLGFGKALVALKLLEYVKGIGAFGAASRQAAADIATKAQATAADTAATVANTTATTANTAARAANATASRAQAAAAAATSAAAGAFVGALGAAGAAAATFGAAVRSVFALIGGLPGLFVAVAVNARDLGTAIGEGIAKWAGYGKQLEENERKLKAIEDAEKAAAKARVDAQAEADRAMQREVVALQKTREGLEGRVAAAEKSVAADKVKAEGIEKLVGLYGNEAEKAEAAVQASQLITAAAEREAVARRELLAAAEQELAKKDELIARNANVSQKVREEAEELRNKVEKMREESAEANNTLRNLQIEAAQRKITAESIKDNSEKVDEYRSNMQGARETLEALVQMQQQGLPVGIALAKAETDLATATALYRDASADATKAIEVKSSAKQAELQLSLAGLNSQLEEARASERIAIANGNETAARIAKIRQKEIELQIFRQTVQLQIIEAEGSIEIAKAKLKEAKDTEPLNKVKITELETTIKIAEANLVLAKARGAQVAALERELTGLRTNTDAKNANRQAAQSTSESLAAERDARLRNLNTIEEENDRLAEQNNLKKIGSQYMTRDGFAANPNGSIITMAGANRNSVYNQAKSAGLSASKAEEIAQQFISERGDRIGFSRNEPWSVALSRVIGEAVRAQDLENERNGTRGAGGMQTQRQQAPGAPGQPVFTSGSSAVKTIRLQMGNGPATSVNLASAQDAAALESFLSQLETSAGRAV